MEVYASSENWVDFQSIFFDSPLPTRISMTLIAEKHENLKCEPPKIRMFTSCETNSRMLEFIDLFLFR